jgi:dihydropyrimidinase
MPKDASLSLVDTRGVCVSFSPVPSQFRCVVSLLLKNGRVVTAERDEILDIYVEKETIASMGRSLSFGADRVIDASGYLVIPGGIDPHTHLDAPVGGTFSSDDFESGTRAAAFGGTTTIIDFATQSRGASLTATLDLWMKKAERSTIDYALHMIVVDLPPSRTDELDAMVRAGVTSFKLFMAYPKTLMSDDATIARILARSRDLGALVCIHAEEGAVIEGLIGHALAAGHTGPLYHALTRPPETEAAATRRVLQLAEAAGAPVYIVHVTCEEALWEVIAAASRGVHVTAETCPQYLLLTVDQLAAPDGAKFVLTPPLRKATNHEPLWTALARNDLQIVATDHCPFFYRKQKLADTTDFTRIPNGGPGIEHRLQLTWHYGVQERRIPLQRWVDMVSAAPARVFGLYPRKGTLQPGSDADIVIWNPARRRTITAATHHMNVDYSLYEGMEVSGNADTVISRGEIIVENGRWAGTPGRGRFLKRQGIPAA